MTPMPIDRALGHPHLLALDLSTRSTWLGVLKAAFALPLSDDERMLFAHVSGGREPPAKRVRELWCLVGRRGDKSEMAGALGVYFACFVPHRLSRGEKGMVLVLAATTEQARVTFDYALSFLQSSVALRKEIASCTGSEIRLKNGIVIAVHPNSFRSVRGRTLVACIFDEVAFWRDDSTATPDTETYTAVLPSLVTTKGMLIGISSAYRRAGLLYTKHKQHFGVDSADTLVVQGGTTLFNPTLSEADIAAMRAADPNGSASEWDATFRDDLEGFLDEKTLDRAIDRDRPLELPPRLDSYYYYKAFVDASGGAAGGDAYTMAIGHSEGRHCIIDLVRGAVGPFDPHEITRRYAELCRRYGVRTVTGDRYALEWVTTTWRREGGIRFLNSEKSTSDHYLESQALFTSGLVSIPDHPILIRELRLLEQVNAPGGRPKVTHPRGAHDDYATVVCGVLSNLGYFDGYHPTRGWIDREPSPPVRFNPWGQPVYT